jgi:hypothetical protein
MSGYEPSLTSSAIEVLRTSGILVTEGTINDWTIRLPDGNHHVVEVKSFHRLPTLKWMLDHSNSHPDRNILLLARKGSRQLQDEALRGSFDLVDLGSGAIVISGQMWSEAPQAEAKRSAKPAWGRWGIMRTLYLSRVPLTQTELAEYVGVAQSAVSQTLKNLNQVRRTERGWIADDRDGLLEAWQDEYRGAAGTSTYWYGLSETRNQAEKAMDLASELQVSHLLTGDLAADQYAPWRLPAMSHIYVEEIIDFTVVGLTPAKEDGATFVATIPGDPTVWRTAHLPATVAGLADPLITYWDVAHSGGPDALEAAEKILEAIRR